MTDDERPKKSAWRWPQLIAVLVILVVLTVVIMPILNMNTKTIARLAQCGKNQSSLYVTFIAHVTNEEVAYPWSTDQFPEKVKDAHSARIVTAQIFGILSRSLSLPPSLLTCPSSPLPKVLKFDGSHPPLTWGIEPGTAIYAFDWSVTSNSGASRIVMADRDPTAHNSGIMVVFGDSHTGKLKLLPVTSHRSGNILITEGADAKPITVSVINKDAANAPADHPELLPDDIYTNEGDAENDSQPLVPAKGHPQRAWVK